MTDITRELHQAFLRPLDGLVLAHSDIETKPLNVDLVLPRPPRLRVYMYSLVGGFGTKRPNEYKAVLRVPKQRVGAYGSFDFSGGRLAILVAYRPELDVFVLWDASLHARFKAGGNIQIRDETVYAAAAHGRAEQMRLLSDKSTEVVIACQSWNLSKAIDDRVAWTGGRTEGLWPSFPS